MLGATFGGLVRGSCPFAALAKCRITRVMRRDRIAACAGQEPGVRKLRFACDLIAFAGLVREWGIARHGRISRFHDQHTSVDP